MELLEAVHSSQKELNELKAHLTHSPHDWRNCQPRVDKLADFVFQSCRDFEWRNKDDEVKVNKMKSFFSKHFVQYFRWGNLCRMVLDKPYGYHGDFKIIDEIYQNKITGQGLQACLDTYFLKTPASIATRNRKEDFKQYLKDIIENTNGQVRIMDLASGPCRDIKELFETLQQHKERIFIDCIDHDLKAIDYAKKLLADIGSDYQINFIQQNALRIALSNQIAKKFSAKYDVIFSTGLFDYMQDSVAVPLIKNLKSILNPHGLLIVSNYRDKWSNPSRHYMEWAGGWDLIYRTEAEFESIFRRAGFSSNQLSIKHEAQMIMQYQFARNTE